MKRKKLKKALSTTAVAALILPTAANVISVPEVAAAAQVGVTYFQTEDNVGQGGTGGPDGDLDYRLGNTNGKHPIEFNVDTKNLPNDSASAALVIRGNDVDEEDGEWDRVFFNHGSKPIGALSGNNNAWNSTVFYLDPADIKEGANYVEILINDKNDPAATTWELQVDWGQIVMNDGPKDQVEIDRQTPPTITGTGSSRTVTYKALPHATGSYIAEINLIDKNGNNVSTVQQKITTNSTDPQEMTAEFSRVKDEEYTVNVIFFEKDNENPGPIQDMWTSNKPPIVKPLTNLTPAAINEAFVDLDNPRDALAEITFSGIPAGTMYAGGKPVEVTNGTVVITPEQIQSGLAFVPKDPATEEVTFDWNGSDGKIYALAPAKVTLKTLFNTLKQNQKLSFLENVNIDDYYKGNGSVTDITITSVPEHLHGLKDQDGNPVKAGQTFTPEEFKALVFDSTSLDEGTAVYHWSVSDGTDESVEMPMTFKVTDGISPSIETAVVNTDDPYPKTITLTYDDEIRVTNPAGFTVNINNVPVHIESAAATGTNQITLTLAEPIQPGEAVTLAYNAGEGNVTDEAGNPATLVADQPVFQIDNQVTEPLNGWVGDRAVDSTDEVIVKPGSPLTLSAISELKAEKVIATLFKGTEDEVSVPLTLISTEKGRKVWRNSEFKLPEAMTTGDYEVVFTAYDAEENVIQTETEPRKANNSLYLVAEIDLVGTVTDQRNGQPLAKAVVTLFDGQTQKPLIDPATKEPFRAETDENGKYKFANVPTGNVYVTVQKSGYRTVNKQTVDAMPKTKAETAVTSNVTLNKASSGGGGGLPIYIPDAALDLSIPNERVLAGTASTVAVKYENKATASLTAGTITVTIPKGAEVVNPDGGKVDGQKITWTLNNVPAGKGGQFNIELKWPKIESAEATVQLDGTFIATNPNTEARTFTSSASVQLYKEKEELLKHTRYIMGYKDGEFKPSESVTRGQLAAILARLTGNPEVKGPLAYRDVSEGHWSADYIKIVTKYGYFSGYSDGTFRQGKPLTRGELASVMVRFMDMKVNQSTNYHFTDTKGHWAAPAIETLYSKNYLSGYKDGTFRPDSQINRAEAVTMINRMLKRGPLKDHASIYSDIDKSFWAFGDIMEATISHESIRNQDGSESFKGKIEDKVK